MEALEALKLAFACMVASTLKRFIDHSLLSCGCVYKERTSNLISLSELPSLTFSLTYPKKSLLPLESNLQKQTMIVSPMLPVEKVCTRSNLVSKPSYYVGGGKGYGTLQMDH